MHQRWRTGLLYLDDDLEALAELGLYMLRSTLLVTEISLKYKSDVSSPVMDFWNCLTNNAPKHWKLPRTMIASLKFCF